VLTKEAHRLNAAATDFRGNAFSDALASSAHPVFPDKKTAHKKTVFVQPPLNIGSVASLHDRLYKHVLRSTPFSL